MPTQIALITGGSRGLGRSTAEHLAAAGVDVVLTYQSNRAAAEEVLAAVASHGRRAAALPLETGAVESFAAFAEQLEEVLRGWDAERFDFLVNNAGGGLSKPYAETTEAEVDELLAVHVKGPYFLTQTLLGLLADGGSIVNVSSGLARFTLPGSSAYAMAKGAVEVLTRYQALELGGRRITVNTVAPGATATDFNGGRIRDNPQFRERVGGMVALGRVGEAEDIGAAISGLLTSSGHWINAQRIEASGGQSI